VDFCSCETAPVFNLFKPDYAMSVMSLRQKNMHVPVIIAQSIQRLAEFTHKTTDQLTIIPAAVPTMRDASNSHLKVT